MSESVLSEKAEPTASTRDSVESKTGETEVTMPDLSLDDLFHVLQNERRRQVLRYLEGREGPVRMRDIAEQVAAWENDTTVENLHSDQRQRVYIALYQSHLPKLDTIGIIRYNQSRGVVEPTPLLEEALGHLHSSARESEAAPNPDVGDSASPSRSPLELAGVGAAMLAGGVVGGAVATLSGVAVGALFLVGYVAIALGVASRTL